MPKERKKVLCIVRQMIECINVYGDGRLTIIFGGGYEIEETL